MPQRSAFDDYIDQVLGEAQRHISGTDFGTSVDSILGAAKSHQGEDPFQTQVDAILKAAQRHLQPDPMPTLEERAVIGGPKVNLSGRRPRPPMELAPFEQAVVAGSAPVRTREGVQPFQPTPVPPPDVPAVPPVPFGPQAALQPLKAIARGVVESGASTAGMLGHAAEYGRNLFGVESTALRGVGLDLPPGMDPTLPPDRAAQVLSQQVRQLEHQFDADPMAAMHASLDPLESPEAFLSKDWWIENLGQGAGSMAAAYALPVSLLRAGKYVPGAAGTVANLVNKIRYALSAARGPAVGAAFEAVIEGGGQGQEALDKGASAEEAADVAVKATAAQFAWLMATAVPGMAKAGTAATRAGSVAAELFGESAQEVGQEGISNWLAQQSYDPQRKLTQGMGTAGVVGGALGAAGGALTHDPDSLAGAIDDILAEAERLRPVGNILGLRPPEPTYGPEAPRYGPLGEHGPEPPPYGPEVAVYGPERGVEGPEPPRYGPLIEHGPELAPYGPERGVEGPEPPRYGPLIEHGPERGVEGPEAPRYGPLAEHGPPEPPSPNPALSRQLIGELRKVGLSDQRIRTIEDEETGGFILDQEREEARKRQEAPPPPVEAPMPSAPVTPKGPVADVPKVLHVAGLFDPDATRDLDELRQDISDTLGRDLFPEEEQALFDRSQGKTPTVPAPPVPPAPVTPKTEAPVTEPPVTPPVTPTTPEAPDVSVAVGLADTFDPEGRRPAELRDDITGLLGRDLTPEEDVAIFGQPAAKPTAPVTPTGGAPTTTAPTQTTSTGNTEPPLAPGMVRMYHGGAAPDATGPLWFSSYRPKAEGYAEKAGGAVSYVDIPADHPAIAPDYPEQSIAAGFHQDVELPADVARQRQPLPAAAQGEVRAPLPRAEKPTAPVAPKQTAPPTAPAPTPTAPTPTASTGNTALDEALKKLESLRKPQAARLPVRPKATEAMAEVQPKPAEVLAAVQVMKAIADSGTTTFADALKTLVAVKGDAWVRELGPTLTRAWTVLARGNPALGASGEVGTILGPPAAPPETTDVHPPDLPSAGSPPQGREDRVPDDERHGDRPDTGRPGGVVQPEGGAGPGAGPVVVGGQPGGVSETLPPGAPPRAPTLAEQRDAADDHELLAPYLRRSDLEGTQHPKLIVETRAQAGVPYPKLTERFQSPHAIEAWKQNRVSIEQVEQSLAAVQANLGERETVTEKAVEEGDLGHLSTVIPDATVEQLEKLVTGARAAGDIEWRIRTDDAGYSYTIGIYAGRAKDDYPNGGKQLYAENHRAPRGAGIEFHDELEARARRMLDAVKIARAGGGKARTRTVVTKQGHGYLIADAVGVGKSRELALTILELMHRAKQDGRQLRLIFMTKSREKNIPDFLNELAYVASGRTLDGRDLAAKDDQERGAPGTVPFEVVRLEDFKKDQKLPVIDRAIYTVDTEANLLRYKESLLNIKAHGIVADEAHRVKNIRGSGKGEAWVDLHRQIYAEAPREQQVFVYATATPAQTVDNLEYLFGLRMWPIDGFSDYVSMVTGAADQRQAETIKNYIDNRGDQRLDTTPPTQKQRMRMGNVRLNQAEAEQIPREMKQLGRTSARDLWRGGTEFTVHKGTLTPEEEVRYTKFANLAREILSAAEEFGTEKGPPIRQLVLAAKRVQLNATLREAIAVAKAKVATGHQVVFSVMHRSEVDNEHKGNLHAAINTIATTIRDPRTGFPVPIPGAEEAKQALFDKAKALGKFDSPIDTVIEAFGEGNVAQMVGDMDATMQEHVKEFQAGTRDVIIITAAGSTGVNLQQKFLTGKGTAQGRRVFIPVQFEWNAIEEMQRYGRVDRADSVMPPIIMPISFDSALEKRFFGTIASRMKSAGALSRGGESETTESLDDHDFSDRLSLEAARVAWSNTPSEVRRLFWGQDFQNPDGTPRDELGPHASMEMITQRLMFLPIQRANQFWEKFVDARKELIEQRGGAGDEDAKTHRLTARPLRRFEINETLTLYMMVDEEGHKFGLLQGVVTPHMPRLREAITDSAGRPRRRYAVVKAPADPLITEGSGKVRNISGLHVQWNRIPRVLAAFGKDIRRWPQRSVTDVRNALDAGETIQLANTNARSGAHYTLRKRQDGTFAIDHASTKEHAALKAAGAEYLTQGDVWVVPRAKLKQFLTDYPVDAPFGEFSTGSDIERETYGARESKPGAPVTAKRTRTQRAKQSVTDLFRTSIRAYPPRSSPPPVPLPSEMEQMTVGQIVDYLEEVLGLPIRSGGYKSKVPGGVIWGYYEGKHEIIRLKVALDLPVVMHEAGHHIARKIAGIDLRQHHAELVWIGRATSPAGYSNDQKRNEGAAEAMRKWMVNPVEAYREAPAYMQEWEAALQERAPELWKHLRELQRQVQGYIQADAIHRVKAHIDFAGDDPDNDQRSTWEYLEHHWIDDLARIRQAEEAMAGSGTLHATESGYALARLARGHAAKASAFLRYGVRSRSGQFRSIGLPEILKPIGTRIEDFGAYLVARRAVELLEGRPVEKRLEEVGIELDEAKETVRRLQSPEFEHAAEQLYEFQDQLLEYAIENGALTREAATLMRELNQNYVPFQRVMDAWAKPYAGATSDRLANWRTPFKRIRTSGRMIIHPLESIVKNTHILVNMVEHNKAMIALTRLADIEDKTAKWLYKMPTPYVPTHFNLQQVERVLREQLKEEGLNLPTHVRDPKTGERRRLDLNVMATIWTPIAFAPGDKRMVTVLREGKRVFYEVNDKALFDSLQAMGPRAIDPMMKAFLAVPARVLRRTVTLTPQFILRNIGRDSWQAMVQSRHGFIPIVDSVAALYSVLKKDDIYQLWLASGGAQAAIQDMSRASLRREVRKLTGLKAERFHQRMFDMVRTPYDFLSAWSEVMEHTTRLGEFRLALQQEGVEHNIAGRIRHQFRHGMGMRNVRLSAESIARAALDTRDVTVDFQRGGASAKSVNAVKAFFNAQIQGAVRAKETFQKNPVRSAIMAAPLSLMSVLVWAMNRDDDRYEEIPQWEKFVFWHIPVSFTDSGFVLIPKPLGPLSSIFSNMVEAGLDFAYKQDPDAVTRGLKNMFGLKGNNWQQYLGSYVASAIPTGMLPWLEVLSNYDFFRDLHIIPRYEEGAFPNRPWLHYNRWTSHVARAIGREMNVPPVYLDHILYGYTGNLGKGVFTVLDSAAAGVGVVPAKPRTVEETIGGLSGYYSDAWRTGSATSIQELYDANDRIAGLREELNRLATLGEFAERLDAVREHPKLVQLQNQGVVIDPNGPIPEGTEAVFNPLIAQAVRDIRALHSQTDAIFNDRTRTAAEKDAEMNAIGMAILHIARVALGKQPMRARSLPVTPAASQTAAQ